MDAMNIIRDEHQSLAAIIHAVHYMLKEIGAGKLAPDFKLLKAMVHYLKEYPEQRHHPKEDQYLFARLKHKTGEADAVIARLEQDHASGEARIEALEAAMNHYEADPKGGYDAFVEAFDGFAKFYRDHMITEEREILPLCRKHFSEQDWAEVSAGFRENRDPMAGTAKPLTHEDFQRVFSKLVAAAPAPIGFGAGPYKED
ncbi:MAG: hemerythrin domain-containing protein [Zoogloeaceae bacterium]|nr:hemerythrin domain-containing protein [Zoogloeaceae bacterium]